jgi:hypothetical protein
LPPRSNVRWRRSTRTSRLTGGGRTISTADLIIRASNTHLPRRPPPPIHDQAGTTRRRPPFCAGRPDTIDPSRSRKRSNHPQVGSGSHRTTCSHTQPVSRPPALSRHGRPYIQVRSGWFRESLQALKKLSPDRDGHRSTQGLCHITRLFIWKRTIAGTGQRV